VRASRLPAAIVLAAAAAGGVAAVLEAATYQTAEPKLAVGTLCRPAPAPPRVQAPARTLYVAPGGSDANRGTYGAPLGSLQGALDRLAPGDTLFLRGGTYSGSFVIARDGTERQPIVIRSYRGENAVIQGRLKIAASHLVVTSLVFDQSGGSVQDVAIWLAGGSDDWIAYDEVRHSARSGIFVGDGVDRLSIVGNWIHDDGTDHRLDHGIYWSGGLGGLVTQNVIQGNAAYGVQLYPNATGIVVQRNTISGNGRSGIVVGGDASQTSNANSLLDNVVAQNGEQGIRTSWDGPVGSGNVARGNVAFGNPLGSVGGDGLTVSGTVEPSGSGTVSAQRYGSQLNTGCVGRIGVAPAR
jgi:parallel beta-helix repeat protein